MSCLWQGVKAICWSVHTAKCLAQVMSAANRDLAVSHENGPSHSPMWARWGNLGCSTRLSSWAAWETCWERAALKVEGHMARKRASGTSGASGEWISWENFYGAIQQVWKTIWWIEKTEDKTCECRMWSHVLVVWRKEKKQLCVVAAGGEVYRHYTSTNTTINKPQLQKMYFLTAGGNRGAVKAPPDDGPTTAMRMEESLGKGEVSSPCPVRKSPGLKVCSFRFRSVALVPFSTRDEHHSFSLQKGGHPEPRARLQLSTLLCTFLPQAPAINISQHCSQS